MLKNTVFADIDEVSCRVDILVCMRDPAERAALCRTLRIWSEYVLVRLQIAAWMPGDGPIPAAAAVFWDLDGGSALPTPELIGERRTRALVVCSSNHRKAVGCYSIRPRPAAFLKKPIRLDSLWRTMDRCAESWWDSLERLDLLCDGARQHIPLYDLLWAESDNRGYLIRTRQDVLRIRRPLRELERALPAHIFLRCHRSFIVNLCHIRGIDGNCLLMSDGSELPLGRGSREAVTGAYDSLCRLQGSTGLHPAEGRR